MSFLSSKNRSQNNFPTVSTVKNIENIYFFKKVIANQEKSIAPYAQKLVTFAKWGKM